MVCELGNVLIHVTYESLIENSWNRHIKYCQRAQTKRKGRPRSCAACSAAKVKCTFARPCSRCEARGEECLYHERAQMRHVSPVQRPRLPNNSAVAGGSEEIEWIDSIIDGAENLLDFASEPTGKLDFILEDEAPSIGVSTGRTNDQLPTLEPSLSHITRHFHDETILQQLSVNNLARLSYRSPKLKVASGLLIQFLSAFPQMMLRRQTFPPFIHPYWHKPALPEKLASCMGISQLFAARTPETRPFLWRIIEADERRFRSEV